MTIASVSNELKDFGINPDGSVATSKTSVSLVNDLSSQVVKTTNDKSDKDTSRENNSQENLQNVTQALDSYMESKGVDLKFHIDDKTDIVQVIVRDPKTDKVIRKIPADDVLNLAASIEKMAGLLYDKQS